MADAAEIELISGLPAGFLREFEQEILGRIPEEKIQAQLRQEKIARVMHQVGSVQMETLGQKIAVIDPRLFFRMQQECGHHEGWLDDLLADNPVLCAPGYKPKRKHDLRHSKTFLGGKPI